MQLKIFISILVLAFAGGAAASENAGKSSFVYQHAAGPAVTVWTYAPTSLSPSTPLVFIMHGVRRNGAEYRDQWSALAEQHGFLVVAPEFSSADFPGADAYNLGWRHDETGLLRPEEAWSYSYIEPIFDEARLRYGLHAEQYAIYGHSAGAQFVHRFAAYAPAPRARAIVAANAGWYQMPSFSHEYPYGLKGGGMEKSALAPYLAKPLVILLGEADTDPAHPSLRRTPEALAQGESRFARGRAFFNAGNSAASDLGTTCNWRLETVPGVAHNNAEMAAYAVEHLLHP